MVGGFDVVHDEDKVRRIIGYLPQQLTSDETMTGYENLLFYAKLYGIPRGIRDKRIDEAFVLLGLKERAKEMVSNYSGGMKRRLELATVLLNRPEILFLDEPTLGLDPGSRSIIWHFLKLLRDEYEITIFLTTNYMDEADRLCDRLAIVDSGRVIVGGSPHELKESVGGEFITLDLGSDGERLGEILKENSQLKLVAQTNGKARLLVEGTSGEKVIPSILGELASKGVEVTSVSLQKPTLDDVFTAYTGKSIKQDASSEDTQTKSRYRWLNLLGSLRL
jgi:ABC-2 type transport system ATP-binding protein